jgi:hypothetical protein
VLPIVLVVVPVEAAAAPYVEQMLEACSAASHAGPCTLETTETEARARVQVTWSSPVRVELEAFESDAGQGAKRTLQFNASDAERERWRTVGFTAALMAGGERGPEPEREPDPRRAWEPGAELQPGRDLGQSPHGDPVRLWALALMGNGLSTSPRAGAELGIDVLPWRAPLSFGVSAEYATTPKAPENLSARWFSVAAGPGWTFAPATDLGAMLRVEALLQQRSVTAKRGPEVDVASEWVLGARLHADVVWPRDEAWAGVIGFNGCLFDGGTTIFREDKQVAEIPAFAVSVGVGLRFLP